MKNSYKVEKENIVFRRAKYDDNFEEIAGLIYDTDPYAYPFWFNNDREIAKKMLAKYISEPNFCFHFDNIYIAYDITASKIIGIIVALDRTVNLKYDYSLLEGVNSRYNITINKFIKEKIREVENNDFLYINNICIDRDYRGKKIGTHLLGYYISQMEKAGFNSFSLICPLHNLRAKNLFHHFGFNEIVELAGFDGTTHSNYEVVSMVRKKGEYLPEEYQNY